MVIEHILELIHLTDREQQLLISVLLLDSQLLLCLWLWLLFILLVLLLLIRDLLDPDPVYPVLVAFLALALVLLVLIPLPACSVLRLTYLTIVVAIFTRSASSLILVRSSLLVALSWIA